MSYFGICVSRRVSDFIGEQNRYERELAKAMDWDFVEGQSKGSSYDYITPDGTKIEAKFDWDSIKTGNHYLEFAEAQFIQHTHYCPLT